MQELKELINQTKDRLGRVNSGLVKQLADSDKFRTFLDKVSTYFPWAKCPVLSIPNLMKLITEVEYCIDHNITSQPKCKNCGAPVEFSHRDNRYPDYCCEVCEYQITINNYERLADMIRERILFKVNNNYTLKQFKVREFLANPKNKTTINEIIQKHFPWLGNFRYEIVYELLYCLENNITERPYCNKCGKPLRFSQKLKKYIECHKQLPEEDVVTEPDWSNVQDVRTYIDKTVRNKNGEYFWLFIDNFMEEYYNNITSLIKKNYPWIDLTKDNRHIFWELIHCIDNNIVEAPKCENCGGLPEFDYYKKEYKRWCRTCIRKLFLTKKEKPKDSLVFQSLEELWDYVIDRRGNISSSRVRKVVSDPTSRESIRQLAKDYKHINIMSNDTSAVYELLYCWKHNIKERPKCAICGKELPFRGFYNNGYGVVCSDKLCQIKYTNKIRDCHNVWEKTKESLIRKYGSLDNYYKERHEKFAVTCMEKYGAPHYMKNTQIADRIVEKSSRTMAQKAVDSFKQSLPYNLEIVEIVPKERLAVLHCKVCNRDFTTDIFSVPACPSCQIKAKSKQEEEISEFVKSLGVTLYRNRKILQESANVFYEIDIFIPEKRVGIEVNGLYFHRTVTHKSVKHSVPRDYHIKKSLLAKDQQILLLHMWEDLWKHKRSLAENLIKSALGLYEQTLDANECDLINLSYAEAQAFFEENWPYDIEISPIRYALLYKSQVVSAITCRLMGKQLHIAGFTNRRGTQVVNGFKRLLDKAIKTTKPSIITADLHLDFNNIPDKTIYAQNGFRLVSNKPFETFYVYIHKLEERKPKQFLTKHKLTEMLKRLNLDEIAADIDNLSQNEVVDLLGGRIYTGYWKFEKIIN